VVVAVVAGADEVLVGADVVVGDEVVEVVAGTGAAVLAGSAELQAAPSSATARIEATVRFMG
jgi:hypothetical protein